jgi:hypothetical protein
MRAHEGADRPEVHYVRSGDVELKGVPDRWRLYAAPSPHEESTR